MGLLDTAPGGLDDTAASTDDAAPAEGAEAAAPEPVVEQPKQRVELPKTPSRRERAKADTDAVLTKVSELEKALTAKEQSWQQELARRDAEIARLQGMTQAQQQFAQSQQKQGPTPEELEAQAEKALDENNYVRHRQLVAQANDLRLKQGFEQMRQEFEKRYPQQQPGGLPVHIQLELAKNPNVRAAGERGLALANAKALELQALYGNQPDTVERAFAAAEAALGGQQARPAQTFSRETAGALAGIPAQRNGNNGSSSRGPGVELTPLQLQVARAAGMTPSEYAKYYAESFPDQVKT